MTIYKLIITQDITFSLKVQLSVLLFIASSSFIFGQIPEKPLPIDSIQSVFSTDSLDIKMPMDSILSLSDSTTIPNTPQNGSLDSISISGDALDTPVDYSAQDSMIYDIAEEKIYLYGNAEVKYESMTINAGFIVVDWGKNEVSAEGILDSVGRMGSFPKFKDKEQDFTAKRMRYNFKTQKGIIYNVTTKQENLYVLGTKSKFVRTEETVPDSDSIITQDIIYSEDAIFTTCDHPEPHFGIRSKKQKVIPGKMVIIGPSRIELAGIPTPLFLPFGFFPTTETKKSGLIFPKGYEYSERWGFGLRDIGYYFPINDYMDLTAKTAIYVKGTFDLGVNWNFRRRYKYNGGIAINYARQRNEALDATVSFDPSFGFRASLNQAAGAHPTRNIGGNINIQFNNYQSQNYNDAQSVLTQTLSSNFSLRQSFTDKPYSFSAAFTHSQNTRSGQMTINFPNFNFQTQTIYPFKRKNIKAGKSLKEQWYEQIAFRYQGEIRANVTGSDTLSQFFDSENFVSGLNAGAQQRATVNTSFKVLKYLSLTPSINYTNSLNFKYTDLSFEDNPVIVIDTFRNELDTSEYTIEQRFVSFGDIVRDTSWGFQPIQELSASLSLNTTLYRTVNFKKGWLRGIRHTLKPSVSMNWSPDYTEGYFDYTATYEERTIDGLVEKVYSPYDRSLYRAPTGERRAAINYSLNSIYEAKYFSKKDSTMKKLKLFENIIVNGNYNFVADSLKFSDLTASGTTRFFKGLSSFRFRAGWSPYALDDTGRRRINTFYRDVTGGKLLRFDQANFNFSTGFSIKQLQDWLKGEGDTNKNTETVGGVIENDDEEIRTAEDVQDYESIGDWLSRFRISHNYTVDLMPKFEEKGDTFLVRTNSLTVSGSIQLSQNWNLNVGNFGYDFKNKGFSYPSFGFSRDLHCWILNFQWYPTRNVYTLNLAVSSSPLDFIRIPYRRNQADGRFQGF